MIFVNGYKIEPTIFPDGTSQVWNLPVELLTAKGYVITWHFQSEREIMDLLALDKLLYEHNGPVPKRLSIPFLPYARQDRPIRNGSAFNLRVFGTLITMLDFTSVTAIDVHNENAAKECIQGFVNRCPLHFHEWAIDKFKPDYLLFPDAGAAKRYPHLDGYPRMIGKKTRDPKTGEINGYGLDMFDVPKTDARILVVDDICDGGATFIQCAKALRGFRLYGQLGLAVTHGIFSKGPALLHAAGYQIFTSDTWHRAREIKNFAPQNETFEVYQWI